MEAEDSFAKDVALARAVAAAVKPVPGVASLSTGRFGETVTYGPNETIRGVAIRRGSEGPVVDICLVAEYSPGESLQDLAARVRRAAVRAAGGNIRVDVTVDDVVTPAGGLA